MNTHQQAAEAHSASIVDSTSTPGGFPDAAFRTHPSESRTLSNWVLAKGSTPSLPSREDGLLSGDERTFIVTAIVEQVMKRVGLVVVMLPTIDCLRRYRRFLDTFELRTASFDLAPTKSDKRLIWEAVERGEIDVILVSPGRLASSRFRSRLQTRPIGLMVVGHAHVMSPWSHQFSQNYRAIGSYIRSLEGVPKIGYVWSVDARVGQDIQRTLGLKTPFHRNLGFDTALTPSLRGEVVKSHEERLALMEEFIWNHECQGVIHVGSLKELYDTNDWLSARGETPHIIRPGIDEFTQQKIRSGFESGEIRIVIAQGPFLSLLGHAPGLEFVVFNGMPDSLEFVAQEVFAHETTSPLACLCLSSDRDFFQHRFAIDKTYPDALTLRKCFQAVKDVFGSHASVTADVLDTHVKVATPFPEDEITQCLDVMFREGLIERVLDGIHDHSVIKLTEVHHHDMNFWHEYPLRKLEHLKRLTRTRDFLTTSGDLGRSLRDTVRI